MVRSAITAALAALLTVAGAAPVIAADSAFSLRQLHVIVAPEPTGKTLQVVEIAIVQNATAAAVDAAIHFPVPSEAYDLDLGAGLLGRSAAVPGGIEFSGALEPGMTQLVLGYRIEYAGAYVFRKTMAVPVAAIDVMVEDAGARVSSRELSGPVAATAGEARFLRMSARDVPAGLTFSVEIRGAFGAAPASALDVGDVLAPVGLVALVLLTGFVLIRPRLRSRRPTPRAPRPPKRRTAPEDDEITEEQLEEEAAPA